MTRSIVAITDPRWPLDHLVDVIRALPAGVCIVQYRDTSGPKTDHARALQDAARASASLFLINGDVKLAAELGADGVHLGGETPDVRGARAELGDVFVSVAAHDDDAVFRACAEGATAALVSPIFATPGKGPPRGLDALVAARRIVMQPEAALVPRPTRAAAQRGLMIYALGGIDLRRAASCVEAGADGVAAIRAIFEDREAAALAKAVGRW